MEIYYYWNENVIPLVGGILIIVRQLLCLIQNKDVCHYWSTNCLCLCNQHDDCIEYPIRELCVCLHIHLIIPYNDDYFSVSIHHFVLCVSRHYSDDCICHDRYI